jgi:hypothetical protein
MHEDDAKDFSLEVWLSQKPDFDQVIEFVLGRQSLITEMFDIIENDLGTLKFTYMKVIQTLCHDHPSLIYPYFNRLASLIHHRNNIIKWGALIALPDLIDIDQKRIFPVLLEDYLKMIDEPSMITAGNAVKGTSVILKFYPERAHEILSCLLRVENNVYLSKGEISPECHHIMIGHVINQFDANYALYPDQSPIHAFVLRQLDNPRKPVSKKARDFLVKHAL